MLFEGMLVDGKRKKVQRVIQGLLLALHECRCSCKQGCGDAVTLVASPAASRRGRAARQQDGGKVL